MKTGKRKILFPSYSLNIFLTISITCLLVAKKLLYDDLLYEGGLVNQFYFLFNQMLLILLIFFFLFVVIVVSLINIAVTVIKAIKTKRANWAITLTAFIPLLILVFIPFSNTSLTIAGASHFLRGYEKWAKQEVDIPVIRQWLIDLPDEHSEKLYWDIKEFPGQLPEAITRLDPQYLIFSDFEEEGRFVKIEWGGGFGTWGIRIGSPTLETPKEEESIKIDGSVWENRRPIEPGVYIYSAG